MEKIDKDGFILEKEGNVILSICNTGRKVRIEQEVIAIKNPFVPYGTKGKVKKILEPLKEGLTSDVIMVKFEGYTTLFNMKLKELLALEIE